MSLQNLFVAKLPRNVGDSDLLHIFHEHHPTSAKIMLDAATGKSKGFGFVLFDEEEKGAKAYKALNRKMTRACGHNFTLVIYPSNHNGKIFTEESNALYIRNIPVSVGQERMERFLKTFGNLTYFAMREDHYGNPVWVVYAEYETVEDAKNALTKLHGNNTYFHGSAPILAKFEDSDDAKKERRRRRDGTQTHVPNSGCIFPPPRDHHEGACSLHNSANTMGSETGNGGLHSNGISSDKVAEASTPSDAAPAPHRSLLGGIGATMPPSLPVSSVTPPPPPYLSSMPDTTSTAQNAATAYSMPQHLLQPTPGYCYTLAQSGQQIFIPATSFSPPVPPFAFAPAAQSAPLLPMNVPPTGPTDAAGTHNFSLLNPAATSTMVLMEDGHQYVLAPDAVNMKRERFSTPASSLVPMPMESPAKSLPGAGSQGNTYPMGTPSSMHAFRSSTMQSSMEQHFFQAPMPAAMPSMSFSVKHTPMNHSASSPFVFMPYNAPA